VTDPLDRARRILRSKPDRYTYWRERGRDRFGRELAADGLSPEEVDAALATLEAELEARVLDDALANVRRSAYHDR
jgi:hypothetical protein